MPNLRLLVKESKLDELCVHCAHMESVQCHNWRLKCELKCQETHDI